MENDLSENSIDKEICIMKLSDVSMFIENIRFTLDMYIRWAQQVFDDCFIFNSILSIALEKTTFEKAI